MLPFGVFPTLQKDGPAGHLFFLPISGLARTLPISLKIGKNLAYGQNLASCFASGKNLANCFASGSGGWTDPWRVRQPADLPGTPTRFACLAADRRVTEPSCA